MNNNDNSNDENKNNIKYLIKTRKMTLQRLSEVIGFSRSFTSFMESGHRTISPEARSRIAAFFGVTEKFVIGEEEAGIIAHLWVTDEKAIEQNEDIIYLTKPEYDSLKKDGKIYEEEMPTTMLVYSGANHEYDKLKTFIYRGFKNVESQESVGVIKVRSEIKNLIPKMNKDQLDKLLLVIKEVILK